MSDPQPVGAPPPVAANSLPPLLTPRSSRPRRLVVILLSLCLGLFLADALVSFVDESLILFFNLHILTVIRGILFLFTLLAAILIYFLMGLTPIIPKRLFLPVTLFNPLVALVVIPFAIYFYGRLQQINWALALCQVVLALVILRLVHGGFKLRWPLVPQEKLKARRFSWLNLAAFFLVNVFVLLPGVIIYLLFCAGLATNHFSEGFLALHPSGFTVQMRKYVRNDGKTIQLFPMAHIGDPGFYQKVSQSFPTNSIILMEGVSDNSDLLTNKITYKRMATTLGLTEQQKEFRPSQGEMVSADVDVDQFGTNTIDFLNLVMRIHAKGMNAQNVMELLQYSPTPHFEEQLFDDLLRKRNRRLLDEIQTRLSETDNIVVPWGVAHMPEIAKEIQKSGFRLNETRDYTVIRFRPAQKKRPNQHRP